jgi:hypothetical protein
MTPEQAAAIEFDFAIDTALSWDGVFPPPGPGDYVVKVQTEDGEERTILVSSRYVGACDAADASEIALDATNERYGSTEGRVASVEEVLERSA